MTEEEKPDEFAEREKFESTRAPGTEYDLGRSIEAAIARHPEPKTVRNVLRELQLAEETFVTDGEPRNDWPVAHRAETLHDRAIVMRIPPDDLFRLRLLAPLTDDEKEEVRKERGRTIPAHLNETLFARPNYVDGYGMAGYFITVNVPDTFELDSSGNRIGVRYRAGTERVVYVGTQVEREAMSEEFFRMRNEVTARYLMMQIWGHHVSYYYALNKLAEGHYFGTTLSSEGLGVLFNLESLEGATDKTVAGVELRSLGDKIETAMRLYYVVALCEKPERFNELMATPGWKQFLFPDGTPTAQLEDWIGQPNAWANRRQAEDKKRGIENTTRKERSEGLRGKLTQKNIFAESDTFVENQLNLAIREFLGGGEGASHVDKIEAESAQRIAFRLFRLFLLADKEGYELLETAPKNDSMDPFDGLEIVFENAPAASDFGKLIHPDMYAGKSKRKNRDYQPPVGFLHSRERYNRFMVDFLRHSAAKTRVNIVEEDGKVRVVEENRSLMERWWGYKGGPVTRDKKEITYQDEEAVQLGDLSWADFRDPITITKEEAALLGLPAGGYHHEVFKSLWLTGFMFGGEGRGHGIISETNHNPKNFLDLGWWQKFWKMLDVGIRPGVALDGIFRGKSDEEIAEAVKRLKVGIVENFVAGLQSLPQWDEWEREEVKVKQKQYKTPRQPQLIDRIIEVANQALEGSGVRLSKASIYGDLLVRRPA